MAESTPPKSHAGKGCLATILAGIVALFGKCATVEKSAAKVLVREVAAGSEFAGAAAKEGHAAGAALHGKGSASWLEHVDKIPDVWNQMRPKDDEQQNPPKLRR